MPRHSRSVVAIAFLIGALAGPIPLGAQSDTNTNYVIGSNDVLSVRVWGQDDVSGQYTVERDGTFTFPLIGRVDTTGLTLRKLELELTRLLTGRFFKNPQVTVSVVENRSKRVFLVGELNQPGTYSLNGDMKLLEALAQAKSPTATAADHVLLIRPANASGPVLPGQDQSAQVTKIDLHALQSGELSQNVALRDGDTIFVPPAATVYIYGQIRNPGSYSVGKETTVRQAVSLAGGMTVFGAANRIKILRVTNGAEQEIKAELNTPVLPGDTIVIPERSF